MARFSAFHGYCCLLLAWSACFTVGLTVEEQIQQLRVSIVSSIIKISFKSFDFVINNVIMSWIEIKLILTTKVTHLENKVLQLETKVNKLEAAEVQLEHTLHSTLRNQRSNVAIESQSTENKESTVYRTCQELRSNDPLLPSGIHPIDPDGQGAGDGPIYVYCNMTTGERISHNVNFQKRRRR